MIIPLEAMAGANAKEFGMSYATVAAEVVTYLEKKDATTLEKSIPGNEIVDHIVQRIGDGDLDIDLKPATVWQYLNRAAVNDAESPVQSSGRRRGYFLDNTSLTNDEQPPKETTEVSSAGGETTKIIEDDLYPLIVSWLEAKGYSSKDVSKQKTGGQWGNPDVLGARRTEAFGAVEIEVASCEVKLSENSWRQYIFEAVAHKRFAHRSWYCMRTKSDELSIPKGIEYYAERYKVGIVQIVLTDEELVKMKTDGADGVAKFIDQVIERIPARYDPVPLREVSDVLSRSGYENSLHTR